MAGYKEILGMLASLFLLVAGLAYALAYFNVADLKQFTDFFLTGLVGLVVGIHFLWLALTRFGVLPRRYYLP